MGTNSHPACGLSKLLTAGNDLTSDWGAKFVYNSENIQCVQMVPLIDDSTVIIGNYKSSSDFLITEVSEGNFIVHFEWYGTIK